MMDASQLQTLRGGTMTNKKECPFSKNDLQNFYVQMGSLDALALLAKVSRPTVKLSGGSENLE